MIASINEKKKKKIIYDLKTGFSLVGTEFHHFKRSLVCTTNLGLHFHVKKEVSE